MAEKGNVEGGVVMAIISNHMPQILFKNYRQSEIVKQILVEFFPVDHPVSYPFMLPVFIDSSKRCQVEGCQNTARIKAVQLMNFPKKWSYYICLYHFEKIFWDFLDTITKKIEETDKKRLEFSANKEARS